MHIEYTGGNAGVSRGRGAGKVEPPTEKIDADTRNEFRLEFETVDLEQAIGDEVQSLTLTRCRRRLKHRSVGAGMIAQQPHATDVFRCQWRNPGKLGESRVEAARQTIIAFTVFELQVLQAIP